MNFSQKLGIFCLAIIALIYIYFYLFYNKNFEFLKQNTNLPEINQQNVQNNELSPSKKEIKTVKIFVSDSKGNLRSVNRKCDTSVEKSCFNFAIKELISAPTEWEKKRGLSSEIPDSTKILSVREGSNNILIDLSENFESGGGAESTYIRVQQLIKTAQANTQMPVFLYINGKQADVIGGEGIMIKQPLSEKSLDD